MIMLEISGDLKNTMDEYRITYRYNGIETDKMVKYSNGVFSISTNGVKNAMLIVKNENGYVCTVYGKEAYNGYELVFPPLDEGIYWFDVYADDNMILSERILSVNNIYDTVTPPKGIIYHIFVDRFCRFGKTSCRDDALLNDDWDNGIPQYQNRQGEALENNEFFGGNLYGVASELDYIKALGAEWIYLSPIFTAYSNHKYDTGDYMTVDEMFGGRKALDELIKKCHENGMKLILDGVFNHVGRDSVYFDYKNKYGGAYKNPLSPYRSWFNINTDGSYDCWWGITNLPKTNKNESFRDYICKTVIPEYMKAGIDGWRLDVVDEYDNSFLKQITSSVKHYNRNAVIIGEVWDDVTNKVAYGEQKKYFCGSCLDSAMNYPIKDGIIDYFLTCRADKLRDVLQNQLKYYPKEKLLLMMNFLGTHDSERILTVFGEGYSNGRSGDELANRLLSKQEKEKAKKMLKAAYALLVCLPGIPSVYYGDEAGLEGYRDPFNRRPFPWKHIDADLMPWFASMNSIRSTHESLIKGDTEIFQCNDGFFVLKRKYEREEIICVCNMSKEHDYFVSPDYIPLNGCGNVLSFCQTGIFERKQ